MGINIGIGVTATPGSVDIVDRIRDAIAKLRTELASSTATGLQTVDAEITQVIAGFQEMGAVIDATDERAVAAFRAEGDALSVYLVQLGATDQQLNKIGASIAKLESQAGAARITPHLDDLGPANVQLDKVPVGARRAGNALSALAFSAAVGGNNMKMMALSMGAAVGGLAQLTSSARLAASATGLGALITVIGTIAILLDGMENKTEKANKALTQFGSLRVAQLETLQKQIEVQFNAAEAAVNSHSRLGLAFTKSGIQASNQLDEIAKKREAVSDAIVEAQKKETHDVFELQKKSNEQALQLQTARLQGEFAAKKLEAEQELKDQETEIAKLTTGDAQKTAALEAARRVRNQKLLAIDKEQADKVKDIIQKNADEILAADAKLNDDKVAEARQAAEREFADALIAIDKLKLVGAGAEQQKTDLIASAAKVRSSKIRAINTEEAKDLKDQVTAAQAEINQLTGNEAEGRAQAIELKYKELIKRLTNIGDTAGVAIVHHLINVEEAAAQMADIQKVVATGADVLQNDLAEIQVRTTTRTLSERDARLATVKAYEKYRDIVRDSIPILQAQADVIGSDEAKLKVEQARLKLLELNQTIKEVGDELFQLKKAAESSIQDGLAQFLDEAASGAHSLGESFQDAARSIVDSLRKVATQMLANLIIQKSLELFGFSGGGLVGGGASRALSGDVPGGVSAASGGYIRGAGTATSDSIPAWLSDGEYVINAKAVQAVGLDLLHAINGANAVPLARRRTRGFAGGGLVAAGNNDPALNSRLFVGLEDGLVLRHLQTTEGQEVLVKFVERNANKLKRALGV